MQNARQNKGRLIVRRIENRMHDYLRDNNLKAVLRLLPRWNAVRTSTYSAEKDWSPGEFLDNYLEWRTFNDLL